MIERVWFKNFKALRDASISFARFTVIVGPNASGKTSVLEGLDCVARLAQEPAHSVFQGDRSPGVLRSRGAEGSMILAIDGLWGRTRSRVQVSVRRDRGNWVFSTSATLGGNLVRFDVSKETPADMAGGRGKLLSSVRSAVLLRLDPGRLGEPSYSADWMPRAEFDGANLAVTLAELALASPAGLQELLTRLRAVVPAVDSMALDRVPIDKTEYVAREDSGGLYEQVHATYEGYRVKLGLRRGGQIAAYAVGGGALIALGLLTVLSRKPLPRLVMVDELERGLHPKALGELVLQIRALMERFPDLQVIGTTHSPYLVDHFSADEVRLTTMGDDGSVLVGKLNEHPDFERWKDEMKPGEFWSTVGEDWLRERKAPAGG